MSRHKYTINHNYFHNIDTPNKACWVGFLLADGCILNHNNGYTLQLHLATKDEKHLKKLKKDIGCNKPLYSQFPRQDSKRLDICSQKIATDLIKVNIVPRKSLKEKVPALPKHLYKDFWRGMIDGDGSIGINKKGLWFISLVGSKDVVNKFASFIKKQLDIPKPTISVGKSGLHQITYAAITKVYLIAQLLYEGSELYLDRKYKKYLQLKKRYLKEKDNKRLIDPTKKQKQYSYQTKNKIAKMYNQGSIKVKNIAKIFHTNNTRIRMIAMQFGVSRNSKESANNWRKYQKRFTQRNLKRISNMYCKQLMPYEQIAKKLNLSTAGVFKIIKKQGLCRSASESQKLRRKHEKSCNKR